MRPSQTRGHCYKAAEIAHSSTSASLSDSCCSSLLAIDVSELTAMHEKRNKNMRPQYIVSWAGQHERVWVFEKDLLPKWRRKIREFNGAVVPSFGISSVVSSP